MFGFALAQTFDALMKVESWSARYDPDENLVNVCVEVDGNKYYGTCSTSPDNQATAFVIAARGALCREQQATTATADDVCRVCGSKTETVVNVNFKPVPVCAVCCVRITKQTVAEM